MEFCYCLLWANLCLPDGGCLLPENISVFVRNTYWYMQLTLAI